MHTGAPRTALEALAWRRLPVSGWPWRSAWYLLTTLPVAVPAFAALGIPWLVLVVRLADGGEQLGTVVLLTLLGALLTVTLGPLVAAPLAIVERRRLRMVDSRPIGHTHGGGAPAGPLTWLLARYTAAATWREVGYACLLATVAPVLSLAALLVVPLAGSFVVSPLLAGAQRPGEEVALGIGQVATVGETPPYVVAGVLMLLLAPYALTLLAGGHAAVARGLLVSAPAERLRAELVEVEHSRARLVDAFEAERHRIQRDLHDGAQQTLVSLSLQLGLARVDLPADSPAAESLATAHDQAKQLMVQLRDLIDGIQPQVLTDRGLPAALAELADQAPIPVTVDSDLAGRLPGQVENTAYFVVAEALTNVAKHSGAASATVTVREHRGVLTLEIGDDGSGGASQRHGGGLTGLADRVAVTGGRMLLSSPPGGPTLIRVELPSVPDR